MVAHQPHRHRRIASKRRAARGAAVIFLSSSRVYPIARLRALPLERRGERLAVPDDASGPGWSADGITTEFPLSGFRSMYGATKLASELLLEDIARCTACRTVINRCGVIAGPWQMGKVDQGFLVLWAARHLYGGPLSYTGFGGDGLQVRDVLHVDDLCDLVRLQMAALRSTPARPTTSAADTHTASRSRN